MRQEKFGKSPEGARLARIKASPHYAKGKFQNLSETPTLTKGHSYLGVLYNSFIKRRPRRIPRGAIPSEKTDLLHLSPDLDVLVWFGHASYFIQIAGKRILVDPVFSGNASPVPGTTKAFPGTDVYQVEDLPDIDYLFISHDHYDHVDYPTIKALRGKVKTLICGLGVGAHFEHWGYPADIIREKDWYEQLELDPGFTVHVEPTRHFSGRKFARNNTLWASYILKTPSLCIYLGGDSGYDSHYAAIGQKYPGIDLAILDNGQYDAAWRYIHNHPEDVLQAAKDLGAKRIFPVHSSKFALAAHDWDAPLKRITMLNRDLHIPLITPKIGACVYLQDTDQTFTPWWLDLP